MAHPARLSSTVADLDRRLRGLLADPEVQAISGVSWTSGGCGQLATALCAWLGPSSSRWAVYDSASSDSEAHLWHVVALVGPWHLDGNGVEDEEDLILWWRGRRIEPQLFPAGDEELRRFEVPMDARKIARITGVLESRLGDGPATARMLAASPPPFRPPVPDESPDDVAF